MRIPTLSAGVQVRRPPVVIAGGRSGIRPAFLAEPLDLKMSDPMMIQVWLRRRNGEPGACICAVACDGEGQNCTPCRCSPPGCGSC